VRSLIAVPMAIALVLISACGNDDSDTATDEATTTSVGSTTSTAVSQTAVCSDETTVTIDDALSGAPVAPQYLTDVQLTTGPDGDQLVFIFEGSTLPVVTASLTTEPLTNTADAVVPVDADASVIALTFQGGTTVDLSGEEFRTTYNGERSITDPEGSSLFLQEAVLVDDFEGQMLWGVGLAQTCSVSITGATSPARVIVDIPAAS